MVGGGGEREGLCDGKRTEDKRDAGDFLIVCMLGDESVERTEGTDSGRAWWNLGWDSRSAINLR